MRVFIFCVLMSFNLQAQTLSSLLHADWEFRQVGTEEWYPASVPGTVHTDLFDNSLIGDPFRDNNEIKQQWIEKENWEYKTRFDVSPEQFNQTHHEILFKGLDTYAEVFLNGELILDANNMFRSWRVDVSKTLKKENNELRIVFTSPIIKNDSIARNHIRLPAGSDTSAYSVYPFTRKAAYHFGWDWAPRFVTSGVWQDIELQSWSQLILKDVFYDYTIEENTIELEVDMYCVANTDAVAELHINGQVFRDSIAKGDSHIYLYPELENIDLWWPNGSGEQKLYEANMLMYTNSDTLAFHSQKIGFRTIELINEPDSIGTSFYFKVNGEPLFMKGANYVPQDVFLPRVKPEQYERLLKQVRDAGMNMLRVWGGGIYEKEIFYDLCDEYGILVWQDFMFANSLYPITPEKHRENILYEIEEQIVRLRNHACLALWCGNNEIDVAWKNWGWQKQYGYSSQDSIDLWSGYTSLFQTSIPAIVSTLNPMTSYVSTSPQSNWGTPENFNHGSMHYWGVWHGDDDFSGFSQNVGRFMVEWGFQSFPNYEILKTYVSKDYLKLDSEVMTNRQKSYVGNSKIIDFIKQYGTLGGDPTLFSLRDFVLHTQWAQAVGYEIALRSHLDTQPHCMGTLLWQLNDCWPGPSWSIINYNGKPKEAYATVKALLAQDN